MRLPDRFGLLGLAFAASLALRASPARAQSPVIEPGTPDVSRNGRAARPAPGAVGGPQDNSPGQQGGVLGGRAGTSTSRAPASITRPAPSFLPPTRGMALPEALPIASVPLYGPLSIPSGAEEEGPPDGLTLDMAIERLRQANLNLRAQAFEIPQAQADILTASLRANPVFYADAQLIPYGGYPKDRPGGQTQYDVNISYPLDVTHKRRARTAVACQAKRVVEAQYQDVVRLQIDNLYTAYVDVLAARETLRFARASREGLGDLLRLAETQQQRQFSSPAEVNRARVQRDAAEIGVQESESALRQTKRALAILLRIPPAQADSIELRGSIRDNTPSPPAEEELVGLALGSRPDIAAYKLGVGRAEADVNLAYANRLSDVYVLYQPFTAQHNPAPQKDSTSWALGVTVPLPIYNRNQGNLQRAKINVQQTRTELVALEEQVAGDVRRASEQYAVSRASVDRIEKDLLPASRQILATAEELYKSGQENLALYLNAQRDYNDIVRQYRDTLVRNRRNMLGLSTAVGQRILP